MTSGVRLARDAPGVSAFGPPDDLLNALEGYFGLTRDLSQAHALGVRGKDRPARSAMRCEHRLGLPGIAP